MYELFEDLRNGFIIIYMIIIIVCLLFLVLHFTTTFSGLDFFVIFLFMRLFSSLFVYVFFGKLSYIAVRFDSYFTFVFIVKAQSKKAHLNVYKTLFPFYWFSFNSIDLSWPICRMS